MPDPWLEEWELKKLTGYRWRSKQARALAEMGIAFRRNPRGEISSCALTPVWRKLRSPSGQTGAPSMPSRKQHDRHLPPRLRRKHGAYYYVRANRWERLSEDYSRALVLWAEREGAEASATTVAAALAHFLEAKQKTLKAKTLAGYEKAAERLGAVFGKMSLDHVRPQDVAQYLARHPSPIAANRDVACLSSLYTFANAQGWLAVPRYNPCDRIPRNRETRRDRYVTDAELAALCDAAAPWLRCLILAAYLTGLRKADLLALRVSDLTDDGIVVRTGKTGKALLIEWSPALRETIDAARDRPVASMWIFARRDGKPLTVSGLDSGWRRLLARLGLDVRWHDLRRKAGSDVELEHARALLGHTDSRVTLAHYRAAPERVKPVR